MNFSRRGPIGAAMVLGATCSCVSYGPLKSDSFAGDAAHLARLGEASEVDVAFETEAACSLQRHDVTRAIDDSGWSKVDTNKLVGRRFKVAERRMNGRPGRGTPFSLALRFDDVDDKRSSFWVRNPPTTSATEAVKSWRCIVDATENEKKKPKLRAKIVRLDVESGSCPAIMPILGTRDDVSMSPYTLTGVGFFAGRAPTASELTGGDPGPLVLGLTLEAEGGEKRLTIPAPVFDRCFSVTDRPPPPPAEAEQLLGWLTGDPEKNPPPPVSLETAETVMGFKRDRCKSTTRGAITHHDCRIAAARITPSPSVGPFGVKILHVTHERFVDALHFVKGKLVPPAEAIDASVLVRTPTLAPTSAFAKAFQAALGKSLDDADARRQRGLKGFRLLAAASTATPATHNVDLAITYSVPEVEISNEARVHKYIIGKKQVHNNAHDVATRAVADAEAGLANAQRAAALAEQAAKAAKAACDRLSGLAALACGGATSVAGSAAAAAAVGSAEKRLAEARATLQTTPTDVMVDDEREYKFDAKVMRRRGEATAEINVAPIGKAATKQPLASVKIPFEAIDVEVPDSPEHKLVGKKANPPSVEDVERKLAEAILPKIDEAIIAWGALHQVGGDVVDLTPGTRPWMVAVARRAANDRPVRLLSDLLENRPDKLASRTLTYPVKMPADSADRCFTFAAIGLDQGVDVNLVLATGSSGDSKAPPMAIARDERGSPDAGFEVCRLPPNDYIVAINVTGAAAKAGVLVSMFESTPGKASEDDARKATKGLPTTPRKGQELLLNGEGVVEFVGTNKAKVKGKTGDRDGDGVLDDDDRCPYDPETANGYLDDDGCPDEPPAGWVKPATAVAGKPSVDVSDTEKRIDEAIEARQPAAAIEAVKKAVKACGPSCPDATMARLLIKEGVALANMPGKASDATRKFTSALALDAEAVLDAKFATPNVKKLWAAAREKVGLK